VNVERKAEQIAQHEALVFLFVYQNQASVGISEHFEEFLLSYHGRKNDMP
jgi:hypothetical protein